MVTGWIKMHQNIAKMPGMCRRWQVQVCNQELTDVQHISSTSEPLFGPTVKIINCSGINLQQTMVRYHLPPPFFLCPSLPCLFCCHQSHFASEMNTLLCPLPSILFSDGCLWNGMEKCLTVLFPFPPLPLPLSPSLCPAFCRLRITQTGYEMLLQALRVIMVSTHGWITWVFTWTHRVKVEQDKGTALRS